MSVVIWRIATEAPAFHASDISGNGAKLTGGRWNSAGIAVLYCSSNIALAALETLSYLNAGLLPFNRYLVRIEIPDDLWGKRSELDPLPGGWDAVPSGLSSRTAGDKWVMQGTSPLLVVPSVIIPEETNILISPIHPENAKISATAVKRWIFDPRFFK